MNLWWFSWTLHLNRYCKHFPTSQYFFSTDNKNELDEELWCSFGKSAILEEKPNSKIVFSWQRGCLTLTASGVAFFFPPSLHMQEKQALRFHNLESNNRWLQSHCVHFCKLGSKFESTVELNYLGWHKLVLDSAHAKFDVWRRPQIVLDEEENCKLLTLPMALGTSQKAKELSTTETTLTVTWLKNGYLWHILPYYIYIYY